MSIIRHLIRNPGTRYFRFLTNAVRNSFVYTDFDQGFMSSVRNCQIEGHVRVADFTTICNAKIGRYSYVSSGTIINQAEIGRFCSIGPGCRIGLGRHPSRDFVSTSPVFFSSKGQCGTSFVASCHFQENESVVLGNDVWIGANVVIADGVRIGNGAILGAGAVVVSNVPDYAVYGGVPARLIRYRFAPSQIDWLNELAWWNRDDTWLRANCRSFQNISRFMADPEVDPTGSKVLEFAAG